MRNWAAYVKAAREHAKMQRSEFATAIGSTYATVWRWETGRQKPENGDVVKRVAEVAGVDLDEALSAAGLRPGSKVPDRPQRQEPPLDPRAKKIAANLQLMSDRLNDPDLSTDERILIETTLNMLVDVAAQARRRTGAET